MVGAPSGPSFFETVNMYFDKAAALTDYPEGLLDQIKPELEAITPMSAVFDRSYVKRLDGPNVKRCARRTGWNHDGCGNKFVINSVRGSARQVQIHG